MQRVWRPDYPMPGTFPDDDAPYAMFEVRYTSVPGSPTHKNDSEKSSAPTKLSLSSVLRYLSRAIKNPFSWAKSTQRQQKRVAEAQQPSPRPRASGFGSYFELPPALANTTSPALAITTPSALAVTITRAPALDITTSPALAITTPTPVSRVVRTQKSPRRWSPYHYEHGKTRPESSVLRSSKRNYRPFEPSLLVISPEKYIDEDISPVDSEGDIEMLAPEFPLRKRKVHVATARYSVLNPSERLDPVHGVPKYFQKHLGINEKFSAAFEHYRDPAPEFDPDQSFLDSPPLPSARLYDEQEMSPSKAYGAVDDDRIASSMNRWVSDLQKRKGQDITAGMSASIRARYEEVEAQRALEESMKRAEERRAREAEENARRARVELLAREYWAQQKHEEDEFKVSAEEKEAMEAIRAEEAAKVEEDKWQKRQDEIDGKTWKLVSDEWNMSLSLYGELKAKMEANSNPREIIVERPLLTRHDLGTIVPNEDGDSTSAWLNDSVVMAALDHLVKFANQQLGHDTRQSEKPAPYHVFNSNWFTAIKGGEGITKWAGKRGVNLKGSKLRKARKILFPVCVGSHWTVTILDPRNGTIESMNSLDTRSDSAYNLQIVNKIRSWLKYELGSEYIPEEWIAQRCMTRQQSNASDCGVFTIMNSMARVTGTPSWSMRQQVQPKFMDYYRIWLAGALFTGGFQKTGPFAVRLEDRSYDGDLMHDPDFHGYQVREAENSN